MLSYRVDCSEGNTISYFNYATDNCSGEPSETGSGTINITDGRAECADAGGVWVVADILGWSRTEVQIAQLAGSEIFATTRPTPSVGLSRAAREARLEERRKRDLQIIIGGVIAALVFLVVVVVITYVCTRDPKEDTTPLKQPESQKKPNKVNYETNTTNMNLNTEHPVNISSNAVGMDADQIEMSVYQWKEPATATGLNKQNDLQTKEEISI